MANDHVREPFRTILESIIRPVPQPPPSEADTRPTITRDRFRILEAIFMRLQEAGVQIDIAQLDWAVKEFEDQMRDLHGKRQYAYEQKREEELARKFGGCRIHDSSIDPGGIR